MCEPVKYAHTSTFQPANAQLLSCVCVKCGGAALRVAVGMVIMKREKRQTLVWHAGHKRARMARRASSRARPASQARWRPPSHSLQRRASPRRCCCNYLFFSWPCPDCPGTLCNSCFMEQMHCAWRLLPTAHHCTHTSTKQRLQVPVCVLSGSGDSLLLIWRLYRGL